MKALFLICLLFLSITHAYVENDNLVIIQKVSNTSKTFIIRKGQSDRVYQGQKSLFTTGKISFIAEAIVSTRYYSQWRPVESNLNIPFDKGQIVNISYSVEKVWNEIPRIITKKKYNEILDIEKSKIQQKRDYLFGARYQVIGSLSTGLGESTTGSENNEGKRSGQQVKLNYSKPLNETFRLVAGFRYDNDTLILAAPEVEEISQRYFLTAGVSARFPGIWNLKPVPYVRFGAGIGKSQTTINDKVRTGNAFLLPALALGVDVNMSPKTSALFELGFESVSAEESFEDGIVQNTNINAATLSIGIQFQ